jgi:hypothetical protein
VAWSSPALSTIAAFQVQLESDPSDPTTWETIVLHPSDPGYSSHTAEFTGLTADTSYTVLAAACDAAGACNWSTPLSVTTAGTPPHHGPPPPCKPGRCF